MSFSKSAWLKSADDESEDDEILEEAVGLPLHLSASHPPQYACLTRR